VGDIARHLTQILQQCGNSVEHFVDRARETIPLVLAAREGYSFVQAPGDDALTGLRNGIDPAHETKPQKENRRLRQ